MLQQLLWGLPEELDATGSPGGLLHYFDETAQHIYVSGTDMATRTLATPEGQYGDPADELTLESDNAYGALRLDHPAFGAVYASWASGGQLVVAVYNYAADVSDIVSVEVSEQIDNAIKGLRLLALNGSPELFDSDMALFCPGAALSLELAMGDSAWTSMGRYYLDTGPYDPLAATQSFQGRSRIGRLLRDNTFDQRGTDLAMASYAGTLPEIVTAIITEISGGELTVADLLIQADSTSRTAKFKPDDSVLTKLTEWLQSLGEPSDGGHATLEYGTMNSDEVRLAQRLINNAMRAGATKLVVDGDFGPKTLAAVKDFQTRKGLSVTGDVDSPTWTALLGGPAEAWDLVELWDGRIVVGNAAWTSKYRPIGRYTFTRGTDVLRRSLDRSLDAAFARVGVRYQVTVDSKKVDRYAYANVDCWPGWAVPAHRTHYLDAPDGATAAQAQELANTTAARLQFVGVGEQSVGPIRPELLVGDIAQVSDDGGSTATVTGVITEVTHKMGRDGYYTTFVTDSGGAIMDIEVDHEGEEPETVEVTTPAKHHPTGGNRRRRISDAVKAVGSNSGTRRIGGYEPEGV